MKVERNQKLMRRIQKLFFIAWFSAIACGCSVTGNSPKFTFADGYYRTRLNGKKYKKYYVTTGTDSIKVYPAHRQIADTNNSITVLFPEHIRPTNFSNKKFNSGSFDLDVITILFKYRPPVTDYPAQLNSNFNGALYAGYRKDTYILSYSNTPLHVANRKIIHHGYSFGAFAGLGSARIDEFVTLRRIDYEYDGVVFTPGVATELDLNKINFVILSGLDFLTDKNSHVWVNNKKVWIGIGIGLNLN
ncbi:MAG TPA: hypothetical protein VIJ95_12400 [Hanamia sp.]